MGVSITIFTLFLLCTNFANGQYNAIFSFGDSYTDTGNLRILSGDKNNPPYGDPYGMTYFHHSTGRASDGRLVIDFIAQNFGLPLLPPSLSNENFKQGANFAVIAATAMDQAFFKSINITGTSPFSLSVQLGWFDKLKPSLCSSEQECQNYFKNSLFFVGELGGNDYNAIMYSGRSVDEIKALSPQIVGTITGAAEKLINEGAGTVVVPGILPTGCIPLVLSQAHNAPKEDFDPKTGCLIKPNDFSSYHNDLLHQAVQQLQSKYPQARLIYAEYFEAVINFILDPIGNGFTNGNGALQVCCGGGGPYNYNSSATCGSPGSTVGDPATYANWDGIHLTEAGFQQVANGWLHGPYASPPLVS